MKSAGGESGREQASDLAGWTGLHYLVGFVLGLRGISVPNEALGQAAAATHPMVEGKLPTVLNIIGTYGGVLAGMVGESDEGGIRMENKERNERIERQPGRSDRSEEQDHSGGPKSTGMDNLVSGDHNGDGDVQLDGNNLKW